MDKEGKVIQERLSDVLNHTYFEAYEGPNSEDYIESREELPFNEERWLDRVNFLIEDTKRTIKKTKSKAPCP